MRRMRSWLAGLLALTAAQGADAFTVDLLVVPAAPSVAVGDTLAVELVMVATLEAGDSVTGVLGWGLDLTLSAPLLATIGSPLLGPIWTAFTTPDGDGLGGVALEGVTGTHLLATLTLEGLAPGVVEIGTTRTANDLTEIFILDPTGSVTPNRGTALVTVVPEPSSALLLLLGVSTLYLRRQL